MKTLLLTNRYEGVPLKILSDAVQKRFDLQMLDSVSQESLILQAVNADYLLVSGNLKINKDVLDSAHNLKMIQRTGVGLDVFDFDELKSHGIPLYVNAGVNSVSVAEHTVMMILSVFRRTAAVDNQVRNGIWKKQQTGLTTHELAGKTVGIIGMGNIGRRAAKMLGGFDVKIIYYDKFRLDPQTEKEYHAVYYSLNELLAKADVISLHCGYDPSKGTLLSAEQFSLMKPGAIIVNTARGKLIDTASLFNALQTGQIAGAGIDTFEDEPVKNDNPLLSCVKNTVLSPHIGGVTYEAFERMMNAAVRNIIAFDEGRLEDIADYKKL